MLKLINGAILALAITIVSGCSITEGIDKQQSRIELERAKLRAIDENEPQYKRIKFHERFYVPPVTSEAVKLPSWYSEPTSLSFASTPFSVVVDSAIGSKPVTVVFGDLEESDRNRLVSVRVHDKPLGEVLRLIGDQAGVAMTYSKGRAVYSKYERVTLPLVALPGKMSSVIGRDGEKTVATGNTSNMSSASSSMTVVSSGQYSTIQLKEHDPTEKLTEAVKAVLSEDGKVTVFPSGPSITIVDRPFNVSEARKVVRAFNDEQSRMVEVEVSLMDVIFSEDNVLNLDYKLMFDALGGKVELGSAGGFSSGGAGTLTPSNFTLKALSGDLDGTQLLIDALRQQGAVSRTVFQKITTTNGMLGRSKAVTRESYIAEQYGNNTTTGGVITSGGTRQEMLETGQVLNIYPRVFRDDVFLKLNSSISADLGIKTKVNESTNTYVESPKVADMEFDQTVIVPDGYTMVIGGLDVGSALTQLSNAGYDVAGFSKSGRSDKKETLMTITVKIVRGRTRGDI